MCRRTGSPTAPTWPASHSTHLVDLPGLVIRLPESTTAIDRLLLAPYDVQGKAVLLHTGWDRHWGADAYGAGGHPYLTADASEDLAARGATLVGIDSVSVDDLTDGARPAHTVLLRHGVIIVEHLRGLGDLPSRDSGSTPPAHGGGRKSRGPSRSTRRYGPVSASPLTIRARASCVLVGIVTGL